MLGSEGTEAGNKHLAAGRDLQALSFRSREQVSVAHLLCEGF